MSDLLDTSKLPSRSFIDEEKEIIIKRKAFELLFYTAATKSNFEIIKFLLDFVEKGKTSNFEKKTKSLVSFCGRGRFFVKQEIFLKVLLEALTNSHFLVVELLVDFIKISGLEKQDKEDFVRTQYFTKIFDMVLIGNQPRIARLLLQIAKDTNLTKEDKHKFVNEKYLIGILKKAAINKDSVEMKFLADLMNYGFIKEKWCLYFGELKTFVRNATIKFCLKLVENELEKKCLENEFARSIRAFELIKQRKAQIKEILSEYQRFDYKEINPVPLSGCVDSMSVSFMNETRVNFENLRIPIRRKLIGKIKRVFSSW